MIPNDLKDWLDENASKFLSEWADEDEEADSLPTGWTREPKAVAHYGGEDQGSDYWTIWQFTHADGTSVLIRVNGWYQSYNGSDYNDYEQVVAKEKTVTVYEKP